MNTEGNIGPGYVRKNLYDYLEAEGLKMNDERHKAVKAAIILHTNATNEELRRGRLNALNALGNVKVGPNVKTIIERVAKFQCPACGLDLKEIKPHEYVAECGHLPNITISIG